VLRGLSPLPVHVAFGIIQAKDEKETAQKAVLANPVKGFS